MTGSSASNCRPPPARPADPHRQRQPERPGPRLGRPTPFVMAGPSTSLPPEEGVDHRDEPGDDEGRRVAIPTIPKGGFRFRLSAKGNPAAAAGALPRICLTT